MHDISSQFVTLSISYLSRRNTKSPASFGKSLKKLRNRGSHIRGFNSSKLDSSRFPQHIAYIHVLSKSQESMLYSFNPKARETKDHLLQSSNILSSPVTAYMYCQAIKNFTGHLVPAWIVKSVTSQPIFRWKEQILRAAIILISRHSKAKLFSPSQEYMSISLNHWSKVTNHSKKTILHWEISFLRDIDWNVHVSRETWVAWEESWRKLETVPEPLWIN